MDDIGPDSDSIPGTAGSELPEKVIESDRNDALLLETAHPWGKIDPDELRTFFGGNGQPVEFRLNDRSVVGTSDHPCLMAFAQAHPTPGSDPRLGSQA